MSATGWKAELRGAVKGCILIRMQDGAVTNHVRRATKGDAEGLVALNREVQTLHAALYPDHFLLETDASAVAAFFSGILAADGHLVAIRDGDDGPSGYIWFEVQQRAATPFTYASRRTYIHHISVRADSRRQGIASALLSWAESHSLAEGIEEILVDHWTDNNAARALFAQSDFTRLREVRRKRLANDR